MCSICNHACTQRLAHFTSNDKFWRMFGNRARTTASLRYTKMGTVGLVHRMRVGARRGSNRTHRAYNCRHSWICFSDLLEKDGVAVHAASIEKRPIRARASHAAHRLHVLHALVLAQRAGEPRQLPARRTRWWMPDIRMSRWWTAMLVKKCRQRCRFAECHLRSWRKWRRLRHRR